MKKILFKIIGKSFFYLNSISQNYQYNCFRNKYNIHEKFIFNGEGIKLYGEGIIKFGENSYIGRNSIIQSSKGSTVAIGKNCKIGPNFSIWTQSSKVDFDYNFESRIEAKIGDIIIENAVWIGANVIINPGVKVGENSIIGANSVVTKDVPAFSIVGGIPAKFIRFKEINI